MNSSFSIGLYYVVLNNSKNNENKEVEMLAEVAKIIIIQPGKVEE